MTDTTEMSERGIALQNAIICIDDQTVHAEAMAPCR